MFGWLRRGTTDGRQVGGNADALVTLASSEALAWRTDATLPIPDWGRQPWPDAHDPQVLHAHASSLAASWLDALAGTLAGGYRRSESHHFMLLAALEPRPSRVLTDYLERSRRRVLSTLPGIASDAGHGKTVVLVFHEEDAYYAYVSNYGNASNEPEAFSGGMFIDAGYGHFVFAQGPFEGMEPVVVHELVHCLVRHLPLPAWLNEGLAVNTERRHAPTPPRYRSDEMAHLFDRFWNPETIQEFWSGKSFLRPDDGQPLSYELARVLVQLLARDYEVLRAFSTTAHRDDAGAEAAQQTLGMSLGTLAGAVLGEGQWEPQPQLWNDGTEKGQFGVILFSMPIIAP